MHRLPRWVLEASAFEPLECQPSAYRVVDACVEHAHDVLVPEGASGTLVLSPLYKDIVVDGMQLNWSGKEKARSLLAPGRHSVTFRISRTGN